MRPIYQIISEIRREWAKQKSGIYFGAVPYLQALAQVSDVTEYFGDDSVDMLIRYLSCNWNTFRGEKAKELKKELLAHLPKPSKK